MIRQVSAWLALLCALAAAPVFAAENGDGAHEIAPAPSLTVSVPARDGTRLFASVYLPRGGARIPTLLAASAYRSDNVSAPESSLFLWRETGPIAWYLAHGYAYVHMDVRGSGRSGGEYRYHDAAEQHDLYDMVEWIARQPWSSGKVGGIGESYYAQEQWFLAEQNPPHLACIAPYDGNPDTYHFSAYQGGIPGAYPSTWYNGTVRAINAWPARGEAREMSWDYAGQMLAHPLYDAFWQTRSAGEALAKIRVPVFSIGVWSKMDLHLDGNVVGFQRVVAPKKLLLIDSKNVAGAAANYADPAFHERYLLPFYDWCLKGEATSYPGEPTVRYFMQGTGRAAHADNWPPAGLQYEPLYLSGAHSGTLHSLNDGTLSPRSSEGGPTSTTYTYPDPQWKGSVFSLDASGRPDPASRKLTFVSAPLEKDMTVAGPIDLVLYASSTNRDTDFIVRLADQPPADDATGNAGPIRSVLVSKGWLRASHRAIDPANSLPHAPWYAGTHADYLEPGQVYEFDIAVMPTAYRFRKGDRIRVEIANGDAWQTDFPFNHLYTPDKVGSDTIFHDASHPSRLMLPLLPAAD